MTGQESVSALQRTLYKQQNKMVYYFLSTVNLMKRSCFMLGIQTERMSERELHQSKDFYFALLCIGSSFVCRGRKIKGETINFAFAIDLTS